MLGNRCIWAVNNTASLKKIGLRRTLQPLRDRMGSKRFRPRMSLYRHHTQFTSHTKQRLVDTAFLHHNQP